MGAADVFKKNLWGICVVQIDETPQEDPSS